jgi:hypothetical protein
MTYGVQVRDAIGDIIFDSDYPSFSYEKKVTRTGTLLRSGFGYTSHDPASPNATVTSVAIISSIYEINVSGVLQGDPNASSALLAFAVPVNGFCFYDQATGNAYTTFPSLQVAVLKPARVLPTPTDPFAIVVFDANGQLTYSSAWPLVRFQGPLRNGSMEQTDWFFLSGSRRRRPNSSGGGASIYANVGVRRTGLTTMQCVFGLVNYSSIGSFGGDSQDSPGFVMYNINV